MKRLFGILGRWRLISVVICAVKIFAILVLSYWFGLLGPDFPNWTRGASMVFSTVSAGKFPSVSTFGAYLGIMVVLAPFYWLWSIIPIEHPPLQELVNSTTPATLLAVIMKLPILICDILVAILIYRLVRKVTKSERQGAIGSLSWFANPYNFYYLYVFGAMDVIPATVVVLALTLGWDRNWSRSGFATTIGGLLRIYPFFTLPFFLHLTKAKKELIGLIVGSTFPIFCLIALLYVTSSGGISALLAIPLTEYWVLEFLGGNIVTGQLLFLSPFLVLMQLYVVFRFWRADANIVHLATVSLLALLIGTTYAPTYAGGMQHFIWLSSLLSVCVGMHPEESWLFAATFVTAYLSPGQYAFNLQFATGPPGPPDLQVVGNFLTGAFWAMKSTYLVRLNLWNLKSAHGRVQLGLVTNMAQPLRTTT